METVNYSVEKDQPEDNERKVGRIRRTQRRKFNEYVAKETIPSRETPPASLKEILQNRSDYQQTELPPEAVLHAVEKAVEQDVAIEAKYERRHEIKDEDTSGAYDGQGTVTGSTSVHQHFIAPVAAKPKAPIKTESTWKLNPVPARPKRQPVAPYKQAILGGVTAALIALLAFGITLLLK